MTPAEYYGLLIKITDAELIADNDVFFVMIDANETLYASPEDFHDTWSSYIPEEYWIELFLLLPESPSAVLKE